MAPISFARGAPSAACLDPKLIADCAATALARDGATILTYGAGGGYGPLRELGRFYEALLDGGRGIVAAATVAAMTARQRVGLFDHTFQHVMDWGLGFIPNPRGSDDRDDPTVPYAYGPHASRRAFGHSGYRSSTAFADPEHGLVVALAVNGTPSDEAHRARFHALCGAIYEDLQLI